MDVLDEIFALVALHLEFYTYNNCSKCPQRGCTTVSQDSKKLRQVDNDLHIPGSAIKVSGYHQISPSNS